jgi:hypothetical protein
VDEIWRVLRDPRVSTTLVLAAVAASGFALIALGWRGAAATLYVALQLPWVVSGALAGIALLGLGLGALMTHLERTEAAAERAALADLQREALRLLSRAAQR